MSDGQSTGPRLVADVMLGRLAKWLRLLGYDTRYDHAASDMVLLRIAQAEDRILLTRDRALVRQRGVRSIWIASQDLPDQIRQVQAEIGPPLDGALTRCAMCNARLVPVDKREVADRVPPYVYQTQDRFQHCPTCDRIYLAATHVDRMRQAMDGWGSAPR